MPHSFHRDDATFAQVDYGDLTGAAPSQVTIADKRVLANISGSTAAASGNTLSDILDNIIGNTRGALLMRGAAWSKIDPGTSGFALLSNGAGADPSYGEVSQVEKYISAQTASASASLIFSSGIDSTYKYYKFVFENIVFSGTNNLIAITVSTDNGSNYKSSSYLSSSSSTTSITAGGGQMASSAPISGSLTLTDPSNSSSRKPISGTLFYVITTTSLPTSTNVYGWWDGGNDAVNAIKFVPNSGTITSGTIRMYGIKGS